MSTNNSRMNIQLLIVDPQNDFCVADDGHGNKGALVVPGADKDMTRLAAMIDRIGPKLDDIHTTLDSHQMFGIERPSFWKRMGDGASPDPITCLDIHPDGKRIVKYIPGSGPDANKFGMVPTEEEYITYVPSHLHTTWGVDPTVQTIKGAFGYLEALRAGGHYPHIVWTYHCVLNTWGWTPVPVLSAALNRWEMGPPRSRVDYVVKGNNPWTEHFSGVQAEVPDPSDPSTQVNTGLVQTIEEADIIVVAGEALSHCVANTVQGIITNFSDSKYAEKIVLLMDAMSNVSGFEFLGDAFVKEVTAKGVKTCTTTEFLA